VHLGGLGQCLLLIRSKTPGGNLVAVYRWRETLKVIYLSQIPYLHQECDIFITYMQTLTELGEAVAARRKTLNMSQSEVAHRSGLTRETLVRFERGQLTEFGSRKLLAVLAALRLEMSFVEAGMSGTLDELRRERGRA